MSYTTIDAQAVDVSERTLPTTKGRPRVLLVSDAALSLEGFGLGRTLSNLFAGYPQDRLSQFVPRRTALPNSPRCQEFEPEFLKKIRRRHFEYVNFALDWINHSYLRFQKFQNFPDHDFVLICGSHVSTFLVGSIVARQNNLPIVVYLMDDLADLNTKRWFGGSGDALLRSLLEGAAGWIMISERLASTYTSRYGLQRPHTLIMHNPVPSALLSETPFPSLQSFSIAYAGSLWGMHFDALQAFATAISLCRRQGLDVTLTIYSDPDSYSRLKNTEDMSGVSYGGLIPYLNLHRQLSQHHLLLVASSFDMRYRKLSHSSVQTKLTDYMASARPILSIGPTDCACHEFIKKWGCGYCCSENTAEAVARVIGEILNDQKHHSTLGANGFKAVFEEFTSEKAEEKLLSFLRRVLGT